MSVQLDIFETCEKQLEANELAKLRTELSNIRRGAFARLGELATEVMSLRLDNDRLRARLSNLESPRYSTGLDAVLDDLATRRVNGTHLSQVPSRQGACDLSGLPLFSGVVFHDTCRL